MLISEDGLNLPESIQRISNPSDIPTFAAACLRLYIPILGTTTVWIATCNLYYYLGVYLSRLSRRFP
jgi:hypothetical protein